MPLHQTENHSVLQALQTEFDHISPSISMDEVPANGLVVKLYCVIDTPFNDASATIKVGAAPTGDDFAKIGDIDMTKAAVTVINIEDTVSVLTDVTITINPKSATQGAGRMIVQFIAP